MVSQLTHNRLINEKSPYLLQHAENPVDWYPWGEEALARARREDKPIFLSIGYSTCHWCHVMERESFEDEEVARGMNELFVSIKVDREERPDLDNFYMSVCQLMTGRGGWPLTVILMPDRKPFFAGTYLPKRGRFGQMGLMELMERVGELWRNRRGEIEDSAGQILTALSEQSEDFSGAELDEIVLNTAYRQLAGRFDKFHGGFGQAPKFPTPHQLMFLLRYGRREDEPEAAQMVEKTLRALRRGGIFDQVGFGFHRYSTDAEWRLPHFEKMLYDQALLLMAYAEAYQASGREEFAQTAREIIAYVHRELTSPEGGFYSAQDADSEGQEGKFYIWTLEEIRRALPAELAELVIKIYGVREQGNFAEEHHNQPSGRNVLHLERPPAQWAQELGVSLDELRAKLESARVQLLAVRENRVHPHKDDKILTDWNGLMIAALAKAAQALAEPQLAELAGRAADFVLQKLTDRQGNLLHRYREGDAAIPGNLDDYQFMIWGLIELYETKFDVKYLEKAWELTEQAFQRFWDEQKGGFFFTAEAGNEALIRRKEIYDGAIPSGNSVAMLNLLRLERLTGRAELEAKAAAIPPAFSALVRQMPSGFCQLLIGLDFALAQSQEVVIVADPAHEETWAMLRELNQAFLPHKVMVLRPAGEATPPPSAFWRGTPGSCRRHREGRRFMSVRISPAASR